MTFKLKGFPKHDTKKTKDKKKVKPNTIGEGFMRPPYKDTVKEQKAGVPYAKRQGYHGYKNFKSNITNK